MYAFRIVHRKWVIVYCPIQVRLTQQQQLRRKSLQLLNLLRELFTPILSLRNCACENHIAALNIRAYIARSHRLYYGYELFHWQYILATDVNASQQRDVFVHRVIHSALASPHRMGASLCP